MNEPETLASTPGTLGEAPKTLRPRYQRMALAVVAGLMVCFSMPPWGWWPLAPVGIALWMFLLRGCPPRSRFATGALVALGWFLPSMLWMYALTIAGWPFGVAMWFPLVMGIVSLAASPKNPAPGLVGALILSEWVRWHAPFGGVPLSVLAMSQGRGPLLPVARVASTLGVSAAIAALGAGLFLLARDATRRKGFVVTALVFAVALGGVFAPRGTPLRDLQVAVVQGGGEQQTVDANTDYTEVLNRHLRAARLATHDPELILLPENIINVGGYFEDSVESQAVGELAAEFGATVIVGVVEDRNDPDYFWNAAAGFDSEGNLAGRYDKVRRVPFGEYVPLRPLIERFGNDLLPGRDAKAGTDPAVIEVEGVTYGVVVSWEVFFPRRVREAVKHDGQIILNPTNGSSYWLSQVQTQQIASSQLRAVESGRWLLQSAPTGFSAVIDPSGNVIERTGISEASLIESTVELRDGLTLGSQFGDLTALVLGFGLVLWSIRPMLLGSFRQRSAHRGTRQTEISR